MPSIKTREIIKILTDLATNNTQCVLFSGTLGECRLVCLGKNMVWLDRRKAMVESCSDVLEKT